MNHRTILRCQSGIRLLRHDLICDCLAVMLAIAFASAAIAQQPPVSVDQFPVLDELPALMRGADGSSIQSLTDWPQRRREIQQLLLDYQYGNLPGRPDRVWATDEKRVVHASGKGWQESLTLVIESTRQRIPLRMRVLLFVPFSAETKGPLPVVVREEGRLDGNAFVTTFFDHDYIFVEYARHDLDPDQKAVVGPAQQAYPDFDWATLAVWAWGGMRVVDYLETRPEVDTSKIAITGHSRGGKMALLAGALDTRFSLVVPVQSGAGGAGCYTLLGPGAESLAMNDKPHWYSDRIQQFVGHADRLPFDQHFLKALVAPRGLLCIESVDDDYANPVGTQLTTLAAQPAYDLFPVSSDVVRNAICYRRGRHSFSQADWQTLLTYAEWLFRGRTPETPDRFRARPYDLPSEWYRAGTAGMSKDATGQLVSHPVPGSVEQPGFVTVGNPGNPPDKNHFGHGRFGSVAYEFEMAKRQVTNAEYAAFLNAVASDASVANLFDQEMAIRRIQQGETTVFVAEEGASSLAVTHTSWLDAIRYCNWLHNGKPQGPLGAATTESGAYELPLSQKFRRSANARYAVPTDHEWYKAAYFDPNQGYQLFSEQHEDLRLVDHPQESKSPWKVAGMYDRLWEWNENEVNGLFRSVRSGAWFVGNNKQAAGRLYANPELRLPNIGIRVVRLR